MGEKLQAVVFIGVGILLAVGGVLGFAALVAAIVCIPALIAWLLWNHALAPAFGWPHASFWLVFAVLWFAGLVRHYVFGSKS